MAILSQIGSFKKNVIPLKGKAGDYDSLLEQIGDAPLVLIGEASHGTHEFYEERAKITKRLIEEKGFRAVAVEADWPDAYRVNRYVQNRGPDQKVEEALGDFKRFPRWMWRNEDVVDFIEWLRLYNKKHPHPEHKAGFYGLDLYSLYSSIDAVLTYLDRMDTDAASRARARYACFDHFDENPQAYAYATETGITQSCEENVLRQLQELNTQAYLYLKRDGFLARDEFFYAEQNAALIQDAEQYYRAMFQSGISSWNLRDQHMAKTLESLRKHLQKEGKLARIVVWEHNSHIGNAQATEMSRRGELNVGQLMRERFQKNVFLIGFTTYTGTVSAASAWDAPVEHKHVLPALAGSYEALFHDAGVNNFLLTFRDHPEAAAQLAVPRLERAIGVIYRPDTERQSHYFHASLSNQFDAVIHWDRTRAVTPLEKAPAWEKDIVPETYPSGL